MPRTCAPRGVAWLATLLALPLLAAAAEPLHERIDRLVEASQVAAPGPPAGDADFVRRAYLDLAGRLPSAADARAFLDERSEGKRAALVERLIAAPEFARRVADALDVWLLERRPDKHVPAAQWRKFLFDSIVANKPYNQLCREIVAADSTDPQQRPAAKFLLDRDAEPDLVTRDLGRWLFGVDLQCAQCHNHPLIDDYLQADYYGIFAGVHRTFVFTAKDKPAELAERGEGEVTWKSAFDKSVKGQTGPRLPGEAPLAEPAIAKGEEYSVKPADNVRPVPKHSRRMLLAAAATSGKNRAFNRAAANRIWALVMGRGLVDPIDLDHSDNPPTHPELLDLLADELVASNFDLRGMARQLALTRAYQRSIDLPPDLPQRAAAGAGQLAALEAEQKRLAEAADQTRSRIKKLDADLNAAGAPLDLATQELAKLQAAQAEAKKALDAATTAAAAAQTDLTNRQATAQSLAEATAKALDAAKRLPDDKELAAAAEKFRARSEQFAAQAAAANKALAERQASAKSTGDAHAAAAQAVAAGAAKVEAARQPLAALQQQVGVLEAQRRADRLALSLAVNRRDEARLLSQYAARAGAIDGALAAAKQAEGDAAAAQQAVQAATADRDAKMAALAAARSASDAAGKAQAALEKQSADRKAAADDLAQALAKLEAAQAKSSDAELGPLRDQLKSKLDAAGEAIKTAETQLTEKRAAAKSAVDALAAAQRTADGVAAGLVAANQKLQAHQQSLKAAQDKAAAERAAAAGDVKEIGETWSRRFALAGVAPLSPEQLAWSFMQAVGLVDQQRAAAEAEWTKANPPDPAKNPGEVAAAKARFVEQFVNDKLQGNVPQFVALYGGAAGQPQTFFATVDQALFLSNGGTLRSWLAPGGGNLTERLLKIAEPAALAEELYLSLFSRRPTPEESAEVASLLAARPEQRPAVVQDLTWALLTSAEFRFNH